MFIHIGLYARVDNTRLFEVCDTKYLFWAHFVHSGKHQWTILEKALQIQLKSYLKILIKKEKTCFHTHINILSSLQLYSKRWSHKNQIQSFFSYVSFRRKPQIWAQPLPFCALINPVWTWNYYYSEYVAVSLTPAIVAVFIIRIISFYNSSIIVVFCRISSEFSVFSKWIEKSE